MFCKTRLFSLALLLGVSILEVASQECINYEENMKEIAACCSAPRPFPHDDMEECVEKANEETDYDEMQTSKCAFMCLYKKLGIVDGSSVNLDRIDEHLAALEGSVRGVYKQAFQYCSKSVSRMKWDPERSTCNPLAITLSICADLQMKFNCPKAYANTKSEICNKLRSGAKLC